MPPIICDMRSGAARKPHRPPVRARPDQAPNETLPTAHCSRPAWPLADNWDAALSPWGQFPHCHCQAWLAPRRPRGPRGATLRCGPPSRPPVSRDGWVGKKLGDRHNFWKRYISPARLRHGGRERGPHGIGADPPRPATSECFCTSSSVSEETNLFIGAQWQNRIGSGTAYERTRGFKFSKYAN